jgi:hypothetical protein
MTLTGPFIDDVAPPASKTRWFAWLSLWPSIGVAVGYLYGNLATVISWRICFFIEAGVALPVVLFCLFAPAVRLRGKADAAAAATAVALAAAAAGALQCHMYRLSLGPVIVSRRRAWGCFLACSRRPRS